MTRCRFLLLALPLLLTLPATPQKASTNIAATAPTVVPALVPYSGVLEATHGRQFSGEASVTFLIYKDEAGGEPLFIETQAVAVDPAGHYEAQIGGTLPSGIPLDLFATGQARWIEVQIAGEKPQARALLASVPYALKAADAATLGGLPASAFALAGSQKFPASGESAPAGAVSNANANVTTPGGSSGYLPVFTGTSTVGNSIVYSSATGLGVGDVPNASAVFDVNGKSIWRGLLNVVRAGNATTSTGYPSFPMVIQASVYNSSSKAMFLPFFQLQAEPTGNNTANTGATFNFLYTGNNGTPAETGLYFNSNGTIHFAAGQTFPGGTGTGTITGVTAGAGLAGGGTSGNVTLKVAVPLVLSGDNATGVIQGVDTGSGNGVYGTSATGFGVNGVGASFGVAGTSSGNIGVYGSGPYAGVSSYGGSYGVLSTSYSPGGDGVDAIGFNGVYATSNAAGGNAIFGVANNGATSDYGVWGESNSGYAGVFSGNVDVTGTLTKSAGTFKIDHPLDPANKYLSHSFVESPDMMNIYNGIAALDGNGEATVQLPDYFAALNKDYRYQLTAIGAPGPNLYIAEEIANNQFKIAGGKGGMKVSWQVTGIRQDAYANAHRTPVEQDKPGKEKGTYLHPDLFGQPEEKGREWAVHPEMMKRMKQDREKQAGAAQSQK